MCINDVLSKRNANEKERKEKERDRDREEKKIIISVHGIVTYGTIYGLIILRYFFFNEIAKLKFSWK